MPGRHSQHSIEPTTILTFVSGANGCAMTKHEIRIDRSVPLAAERPSGHNRWHPGIPPRVTCEPGDEVLIETRDAFDRQFHPGATVADVRNVDLNLVHPHTGPVHVECHWIAEAVGRGAVTGLDCGP
jgi:hypothetical protein